MIKTPDTVYELLAIQEDTDDDELYTRKMSDCPDSEALARFIIDVVSDLLPNHKQVDRAIAALERFKDAQVS